MLKLAPGAFRTQKNNITHAHNHPPRPSAHTHVMWSRTCGRRAKKIRIGSCVKKM